VPVQGFVFFVDRGRKSRIAVAQVFVGCAGMEELRALKGVDMVRHATLAQNGISSCVARHLVEQAHLDEIGIHRVMVDHNGSEKKAACRHCDGENGRRQG
jgi:hypothetical protein